MSDTAQFRASTRLVLPRMVRSGWGIALLAAAATGWVADRPQPWRAVLYVAVSAVVAALVLSPVYDILCRRLVVTPTHLTLVSGWVAPTERTVALDDVSSIQVDSPWTLQVVGLSTVTVSAQGRDATSIVMAGLTHADAARLHAMVLGGDEAPHGDRRSPAPGPGPGTGASGTSPPPPSDPVPGAAADQVLYSASTRDLAATMASQGVVVTAVLAVLGLLSDLGDLLHIDVGHLALPWMLPLGVLLVGATSVALSAAQLRNMSISALGRDRYRVSHGALGRVQHDIRRDDVLTVTLTTTPVDLLFGTTRLSLGTAVPGAAEHGHRLRFPSMPTEVALGVVTAVTGLTGAEAPRGGLRALGLPLLSLGAGASVAYALPPWPVEVRAAAVLASVVLAAAVVRYATCRLSVSADGSHLVVTRDGLSRTISYCARPWARAVVMRRLPLLRVAHLCVVGYAHRRQAVRLPAPSPAPFLQLTELLDRRSSTPWSTPAARGATP